MVCHRVNEGTIKARVEECGPVSGLHLYRSIYNGCKAERMFLSTEQFAEQHQIRAEIKFFYLE